MKRWLLFGGIALVVLWWLGKRAAKTDTGSVAQPGIAPRPSAMMALNPPTIREIPQSRIRLG